MPGYAQNYAMNGSQNLSTVAGASAIGPNGMAVSQPGTFYPQSSAGSFPPYTPSQQQGQMGPPIMDNSSMVADFTSTQSVDTPTQYQSTSSQQVSPAQEMANAMEHTPSIGTGGPSFETYFDPNDPSLFNFNISDLNFGNHYGALEFGMLGHISSGAVNTPEVDQMNSISHSNQGSVSYEGSANYDSNTNYNYNQAFPSWSQAPGAGSRHNSGNNLWTPQNNGLEAYAIAEQGSSITTASPHSQSQDFLRFQSSTLSPETQFAQPEQHQQSDLLRQSLSQAQRKPPAFPGDPNAELKKPRRNTSEIYTSVQAPYSYTQGFHALTAFLQKRYPKNKVLRIAKALANIRPSFISCNQRLNQDDLIFMEKCFQRTLCEYEDFISHYGTPTIICRRTGEIAAVSKEFCLVTGWRRDVILGREPNLNVNTGGTSSGTQTGASSRGVATPRMPNVDLDPGRPQSVFLAELMDEDSTVQFYEDFSDLAFGATHNSIIGATCSLLKYRTKEDPGWGPNDHLTDDGKRIKNPGEIKSEPLIRGEAGMNALGERDGRVECQMCWTVKRDVFDIPMLLVMNVSKHLLRVDVYMSLTRYSSYQSYATHVMAIACDHDLDGVVRMHRTLSAGWTTYRHETLLMGVWGSSMDCALLLSTIGYD